MYRGFLDGGLTGPQVDMMVRFAQEDDDRKVRFEAAVHGVKLDEKPGVPEKAGFDQPDWVPEGVVLGDPKTYEGLDDETRKKLADEQMKNLGVLIGLS